jgi:hypothetical protein
MQSIESDSDALKARVQAILDIAISTVGSLATTFVTADKISYQSEQPAMDLGKASHVHVKAGRVGNESDEDGSGEADADGEEDDTMLDVID